MKLKERLQNNNIPKRLYGKKKSELLTDNLFIDCVEVKQLIVDLVEQGKNIIFVTNKSFDKIIIANYFKSLLKETDTNIIDDFNIQFNDFDNQVSIVPNTDINMFIKISQQIIYGCKPFILGFNFASFDNISDKLKLLIALNNKNLSSSDIVTLIGSINAVFVYVEKDKNGLFYVSKIDEIKYKNGINIELQTLLTKDETETETELKQEIENAVEINQETEQKQEELDSQEQAQIEEQMEEPVIEEQQEKKLNKYQLLREKIRKKRENA